MSEDTLMPKFPVRIPAANLALLNAIAKEKEIPISYLVNIAIDNELDLDNPFNYPIPPVEMNMEARRYSEAQRIIDWLKKANNALSLKMMLMSRREIGIEDRQVYVEALAEAIHNGFIEECRPKTKWFKYRSDELFYRSVDAFDREKQKATRRAKLQAALARLDDE